MALYFAIAVGALLILALAFFWGRSIGRNAENKVIRGALENAGLSRERFDKIMAEPLAPSNNLFDDWMQDGDNKANGPVS